MKIKDFNYIYNAIENEIEQGAELVSGIKPTIAEMLEYHISEHDRNCLMWLFADYDEERGDINSVNDLTEDERSQLKELCRYCEN